MQWGDKSGIGFKSDDSGRVKYHLPGSLTEKAFDVRNYSNVQVPGLFIYQIDGETRVYSL